MPVEYLLTGLSRSFQNVQTLLVWAEVVEGEPTLCVEVEVVVEDSEAVADLEGATAVVTVAHEAVREVAFEVEVEAMLPTEEERYSSRASSFQRARDSSQCCK